MAMNIEARPMDRDEQTELPEPVKVQMRGKLRNKLNDRSKDCAHDEVYIVSMYRAYHRQETNIVIETEEEVYSVLGDLSFYSVPGVTWMNGPMMKCVRRVEGEIHSQLEDMGVDVDLRGQ